eukprot:augustus_masked-scaffold_26-processed-gene-2.7-mRNA-1 protein AED:1.00 eAED:1.00 QI:0/0/0/0/1/1/2/0/227
MLDMRDAYLEVYDNEKEPNLCIHVDPELKQSLSHSGVTKEGLVDYLRKYMREHEAYDGEDTLRTIEEKVTGAQEGPFLERLNSYISEAAGCMKWDLLKENGPKLEILKTLNNRLRNNSGLRKYKGGLNGGWCIPRSERRNYRQEDNSYGGDDRSQCRELKSFLALPALKDGYKKDRQNITRRLNVPVRRIVREGVTIHPMESHGNIPNTILDSGADDASLRYISTLG